MTLEEYRQNVANIINTVGIHSQTFSDLEGLENIDEFLRVCEFYQETLELNYDYGIEPARFFFVNSDTINAKAKRSEGFYLLGINRGTVNWLVDNFKNNESLITDNNIFLFDKLSPYLDTPINQLMYDFGIHFTFYHEMAHLIQSSDYLEQSLEENPQPLPEFDYRRHLLEIDADTYSALCLGTHIMQYANNIFGENVSQILVEALVVLFSVPIILYILSFEGNSVETYYRESTHPHPSIRLTNLLLVLTQYCNDVLNGRNLGFTISQGNTFLVAMGIAEKLQLQFFGDTTVSTYMAEMIANREDVVAYLGELVESNTPIATNATFKWNARHS